MDISQSLRQILTSREVFGDAFYNVFLTRHPDVKRHFENVDMKRQGLVLTMALTMVEQYYRCAYPATEKYLQYLGTKHLDLAIPREHYTLWTDAMLETLATFHGSTWNAELHKQWQEAIGRTTELMFEGYEKRFHI